MAILQENKWKVQPIMDYCEFNEHVDAYTASTDICAQNLRKWQQQSPKVAVLDLHWANLQVHIKKPLAIPDSRDQGGEVLSHPVGIRA